jgi:hypothetical protein
MSAIIGAAVNSTRSAFTGVMSSFVISFTTSATGCRMP